MRNFKLLSCCVLYFLLPLFLLGQDYRYAPEAKGTLIKNQLEALTGIDFFPQLPRELQAKIESQIVWWE